MSNEKRSILFFVMLFVWLLGAPYVLKLAGLTPTPKKPAAPPAPAAVADAEKKLTDVAKAEPAALPVHKLEGVKAGDLASAKSEPGTAESAPKSDVALVPPTELMLGSVADKTPAGYRLEVQLDQKGAGVYAVSSSRYDAEFDEKRPGKRPLELIRWDSLNPAPLSITLTTGDGVPKLEENSNPSNDGFDEVSRTAVANAEDWLDTVVWEVVRDDQGRVVHPESRIDPVTKAEAAGQSATFRTKARNGVVVSKTFRLWQNTDGLEVELKFESPDKARTFSYNLLGPHGIPIEGEWYTGTFRDLVIGQLDGNKVKIDTQSAYDVAKSEKPIEYTALPLSFGGVENQYFATLVEPDSPPTGSTDRRDTKVTAVVLHKDDKALQKADVGIRITSKPISPGPEGAVVHTYKVFAGPKTAEALAPFGAEGLATYRKNQWIPFAPDLARYVITPTLAMTYRVTTWVSHQFGGIRGNYGIAIILLTLLVRGLMFPLGRKQALAAQKMQELQPHLKAIQAKYGDDKERQTKETFALYKKYGVNPLGGCLPALIQLPIFVGLWQALNTSVPLRHAQFLWIRDLSAPDMLVRFPMEIPFLGYWFNLLPLVVVALMLFQTKLFSPPATTPEQEQQQKMMKYMMIFMAVMFYKVPSGLGIYFITSSLWAIGERLLLPKLSHAHAHVDAELSDDEGGVEKGSGGRSGKGAALNSNGPGPRGGKSGVGNGTAAKPPGRFAQFWERVLDEARKDSTYRKLSDERDDKGRDKDKNDPRPRPRRR